MLSWLRIATLVLLASAMALLGYTLSRGGASEVDDRYRQRLRDLGATNTSLDASLLRSRSGIDNHYDSIVRHVKTRDGHRAALERYPTFLDKQAHAELKAAVAELKKVLEEENELIESFKSDNAILRNSVRYLPSLARELTDDHNDRPDGGELAAKLNALFTDVLLYHDFGGRARVRRVQKHLRDLSVLQATVSQADSRALVLLAKHAEKVLQKKDAVDGHLRRSSALPIGQRTEAVRVVYDRHHAVAVATTEQIRLMLFVLSLATVVCGAAYVILRLQISARALRRTTSDLEGALVSLEGEKEKQKELAELKSRFVSMTSHEFRTPLSAILSSAELLATYGEQWASEKKQAHLARIQTGARKMVRMLQGVLLIGKADGGMLSFNPSRVDLGKLCEDMVAGFRQDADTGQEIVMKLDPDLFDCHLDEGLFGHVLSNLLSNAIKYSERESTVRVDVRRDANDVELSVADEGIGISQNDQEHVFETFHRGSNVGTVNGTGLGLAIVQKSVEVHGGSIEVTSAPGVGTRFVVRLPLQSGAA